MLLIPIEYRIENEDESVTLDFKREIYTKEKNQEFLKDVVAFANALSNDPYRYIVIGVKEQSGLKEYFDIKRDRKSTRLNSSHVSISYAVFCLKKKKI